MVVQIGDSVRRVEDPRLITGNGTYVDDVVLPGLLHLSIVRSPYAHAKITRIDVSAAVNIPGVVAAFTAADLADQLGSLPVGWVVEGTKLPDHPPLAIDTVRYVGDAVAVVVADDKATAVDAAELVTVDYEQLPVVVGSEEAQKPDAPELHAEAPGNVAFEWEVNGGDWRRRPERPRSS